jgi:DNA modification methylase
MHAALQVLSGLLIVLVVYVIALSVMGVGSFGVAALSSGRRFIGCEVDEDRHNQSLLRLGRLP